MGPSTGRIESWYLLLRNDVKVLVGSLLVDPVMVLESTKESWHQGIHSRTQICYQTN